jgi:hypothetical protein
MATIPEGFRPPASVLVPCVYSIANDNNVRGFGIVSVLTTGAVYFLTGEVAAPANSRLFFNLAYSVA